MATTAVRARSLFESAIVKRAIVDSFRTLGFTRQVRNPVMFLVYVGSILTTLTIQPGRLVTLVSRGRVLVSIARPL